MFEGLFILGLLVGFIGTICRCVQLECRALDAESAIVDIQIKIEELEALQPSRKALTMLALMVGTCEVDGFCSTPNGSPFWVKVPMECWVRNSDLNLKQIS